MTVLLEAKGIDRKYSGVPALKDVSVTVAEGEVHAVCGENGAGKSTLLKILMGVEQPDSGELLWRGKKVAPANAREGSQLGISMVQQELHVIPQLTVGENVFASMLPRRGGIFVDWKRLHSQTDNTLRRIGARFASTDIVANLSIAQRQLVEIAKALIKSSSLLILDEPTAPLTSIETNALLNIVKTLKSEGVSVLYVSHRLEEVFEIADTITVLRDGRLVWTGPSNETSPDRVVNSMVGRAVDLAVGASTAPLTDIRLQVEHLHREGTFSDISFSLRGGEVVGLYGLIGAGRTEMARALFGLDPIDSGTIVLEGRPLVHPTPSRCLSRGLAYSSEDRKALGLVLSLSVRSNLTMASLRNLTVAGFVMPGDEKRLASEMIKRLRVKPTNPSRVTQTLSGGNQQKVVLGKWLAVSPRVLMLDEPTRGVDVGAKEEIYQIVRNLAAEGLSVLFISSELPEVINLPHRVLVMRAGRLVGDVPASKATEQLLLGLAMGTTVTEQMAAIRGLDEK